eukprot:gene3474-6123_t
MSTEKLGELMDQLKNEFTKVESELNVTKVQKDDYERKLESQIHEFQSMKQTIYDLEMNYQNLKQQYEEEIGRLRRKLDGKNPNKPTSPVSTLSSLSNGTPKPTSPISTNGSSTNSQPPNKKPKMDNIKFPSLAQHASSNVPSNTNIPSMSETKDEEEVDVPPFHQILEGDKKPEEVKVENFEKKQSGNDWVVVYNPQVKTNVNINLFHNLEHQSVVCCVKFSKDGKKIATGSNKAAQIFDVETGEKLMGLPEIDNTSNKEDSYVRSVCFSPDGNFLVSGAEDKTVKVWNVQEKKLKYSLTGHDLDIYSLDYSCDNKTVVSGSGDGKAKIWNVNEGKCVYTLGNSTVGPKEGVTSVSISPDGKTVAAGSLDCVVRLWDINTGNFIGSLKGHEDSVYSVAFSPDGQSLASGSLDKTLKIWDVKNLKPVSTLTGHRDYVLSVSFSNDGNWLISGSKDRSIQFWDTRNTILHLMLQGHKNSVISVSLNPTQQIFATGSGDCRARLWRYDSSLNNIL